MIKSNKEGLSNEMSFNEILDELNSYFEQNELLKSYQSTFYTKGLSQFHYILNQNYDSCAKCKHFKPILEEYVNQLSNFDFELDSPPLSKRKDLLDTYYIPIMGHLTKDHNFYIQNWKQSLLVGLLIDLSLYFTGVSKMLNYLPIGVIITITFGQLIALYKSKKDKILFVKGGWSYPE